MVRGWRRRWQHQGRLTSAFEAAHTRSLADVLPLCDRVLQAYVPARARKSGASFAASSPTASPLGLGARPNLSAGASSFTPNRSASSASQHSLYSRPSPQTSPSTGKSTPATATIDPKNLIVQSLDRDVSSDDLHDAFSSCGTVTSAKVMRDEHGVSRGFGFVSFATAEEAALALRKMDGARLGAGVKPISVNQHEPKAIREPKLRERFGALAVSDNGSTDSAPRSSSGVVASEPVSGRARSSLAYMTC